MRSFTALVNPISGGGVAPRRWQALAGHAEAAGARVNVELTRSREHAIELAAEAAHRGDVVVAVGGDGLVRDAAAGVVQAGGTLALVPAGRGNDLARKLGIPIDPAAHRELGELLLGGTVRSMDVMEAGGHVVLGNVYMGIDSTANAIINKNRWIPGALLYRVAPVRAILGWKPPTYTVTVDGETITSRADSVVVANTGTYGRGLKIVPDAVVDDGLLDVMIVSAGPKRAVVKFMTEARTGAHVQRPQVRIVRARSVTVATDRPVPVGIDGEDLGHTPCTIMIRPGALKIIAP